MRDVYRRAPYYNNNNNNKYWKTGGFGGKKKSVTTTGEIALINKYIPRVCSVYIYLIQLGDDTHV